MRSWPQADIFGEGGGAEGALEHRFDVDIARVPGSGRLAFSSIIVVSKSWSSDPQFTPMRTGLPFVDGDLDDRAEVARRGVCCRHCRD